jgi:hypothetical protein
MSRMKTATMKLDPQQSLRAVKWDAEMVPCRLHPDIRCQRAGYVRNGRRRCSKCDNAMLAHKRSQAKYRASDFYREQRALYALIRRNNFRLGENMT